MDQRESLADCGVRISQNSARLLRQHITHLPPPREKGCSTMPPPRGIVHTDPLLCLSHLMSSRTAGQPSHSLEAAWYRRAVLDSPSDDKARHEIVLVVIIQLVEQVAHSSDLRILAELDAARWRSGCQGQAGVCHSGAKVFFAPVLRDEELDIIGEGLGVRGGAGAAHGDIVADRGDLVGDTVRDVRACGEGDTAQLGVRISPAGVGAPQPALGRPRPVHPRAARHERLWDSRGAVQEGRGRGNRSRSESRRPSRRLLRRRCSGLP